MHQFINEPTLIVGDKKLNMTFSPTGVLSAIRSEKLMVSLFDTPLNELSISNIYLRTFDQDIISATPLLFFNEEIETFKQKGGSLAWKTTTDKYEALVSLRIVDSAFFYDVTVSNIGSHDLSFDLVYGQDLGLADEGAVKTNEAYCSQYLDHQIHQLDDYGFTVCSRQNLPQSAGNPRIQIGSFSPVIGFSTDGYQFFGQEYKVTGEAMALKKHELANEKYQYEMGYIALQTESVTLAPNNDSVQTFYGVVESHCEESNLKQHIDISSIQSIYARGEHAVDCDNALPYKPQGKAPYIKGENLTEHELSELFGTERRFSESKDGELLSFFYGDSQYVTLAAKEQHMERTTGHVIATGNNTDYQDSIMSATHHIFGVFNSQLTLGNTSFNKLLGVCRNPLNHFSNGGQRIWIKEGNTYQALGMPSAYEVGTNYSRWIYKYLNGFIDVRSFAASATPNIQLEIEIRGLDTALDIAVSHQLVFGNNESDSVISVAQGEDGLTIKGRNELIEKFSPELSFSLLPSLELSEWDIISNPETGSVDYLVLKGLVHDKARITFGGELAGINSKGQCIEFNEETEKCESQRLKLTKGFKLHFEHDEINSQRLNETVHWFTHNALVHYSTPHGLEQYSGAAWGTRDVSQGPFELFMSMQEYGKARDLLKEIYSHQYQETGTWPQWFMFDQYAQIQQEDAHGDIIVWPLKALGEYLAVTSDFSLLDEMLPYTLAKEEFAKSDDHYSLFSHVERQIQHIIDNLVPGTSLSCYGDGDWDDTLQPANQSLRENMVSGWTIPLTLQALKGMARVLKDVTKFNHFSDELTKLATDMEQDYHHYLIKDEVIAGFIHFARDGQGEVEEVEYLLHPSDKNTGIKYRLLPASRSIISETFTPEMAHEHMTMIKEHLVHPDGVRLMDRMAEYKAGKQTYFKRAELAANLGREVGLQYCHAHIRFIEALCKLGDAEAVFDNLYKIIPVGIQDIVPNAEIRQSNAYFSSSDAKFNDRYSAYDNFDKVKAGEVSVKGGWRIYSSGPGIYLNQLISNVFGLRFERGNLVLDPIVSSRLGTVSMDYEVEGKAVKVVIESIEGQYTPKTIQLNGVDVPFELQSNRYRTGGAVIESNYLKNKLNDSGNILKVTL
ncbi:GH36-type glycosyl hydrolase domain-containing protein [Vibrio hippocampi]|uniref:1,2-beta-oligoglucan phosphorylase n=1 Tax=Vibrio hippocampi TaxID=654686 RepID=A0ABN8DHZ3_9VIBR|nr:cellobiose phosphorylase [Vibrio hippocampi]CAH0525314.1 1,2-beta-oligoglucan phosphorylase [Vibrio hippocampi]